MDESEESQVTAQERNPRAALMEMLNRRQPKVEAMAVHQSLSSTPFMPLSPIPISNVTLGQPTSPPSSYEKQQLRPESPTIDCFFPDAMRNLQRQSTLDDENQSEREARYENKTSCDARGSREAESTSPLSKILAGISNANLLEIPSLSNTLDQSPESKCVNSITATAVMRRFSDKLGHEAEGTMSIAAMAAAAAREKNAMTAALPSSLTAALEKDDAAIEDHSQIPTEKTTFT